MPRSFCRAPVSAGRDACGCQEGRFAVYATAVSGTSGGLSGGAAYLALGISWLERRRAEGDDGE